MQTRLVKLLDTIEIQCETEQEAVYIVCKLVSEYMESSRIKRSTTDRLKLFRALYGIGEDGQISPDELLEKHIAKEIGICHTTLAKHKKRFERWLSRLE